MDKISMEELNRDDWLELALEGQLAQLNAQRRGLLQSSAATAGASSSLGSGGVLHTAHALRLSICLPSY